MITSISLTGCSADLFNQDAWVVEDPSALECALTALQERSPGFVSWVSTDNPLGYDKGFILINEDRDLRTQDRVG